MTAVPAGDLAGPLGHLERAVMDVLWQLEQPATARQVHARVVANSDRSTALAYATVKTVLDRLARKDLVRRTPEPDGRAVLYRASGSPDNYIAELMLAALDQAGNRGTALMRFVEAVSADEATVLRRHLDSGRDQEKP